jgi:hypothetical protein
MLYYNYVMTLRISYLQMLLGDLCHLLLAMLILIQVLLKRHPHEHETLLTNLETPELVLSPFSPSECPNFIGTHHSAEN